MAVPSSVGVVTELHVSLSLATDLGFGQPAEHMLRSARIGMRIGERLGLDGAQIATLYDVSVLTYVGCPVYGNEAAAMFGDDIDFRANAVELDLTGFPAMVFMLRRAGSGGSPLHRARQAAGFMATGGRGLVEPIAQHCAAAGELADRLGLSADVRSGIQQSYARWGGKGVRIRSCSLLLSGPGRARCSSAPPASTPPSRWCAPVAAPTSTRPSPSLSRPTPRRCSRA
jgi:hypothetical protein